MGIKPAYYNEIEPYAAQWLRNLITRGVIAPGDVDERSIEDVRPDDLTGYGQVHLFAGIGVWSHALRRAGWPDDREVWTVSCPCQPFSSAGEGAGFADERHLWPAAFHLISQRRPVAVIGEQVEAAIRHSWLDLVQTDLENLGYAFGATGLPACGLGAPHIRQRIFFVADAASVRLDGKRGAETFEVQGHGAERGWAHPQSELSGKLPRRFEGLCRNGELANANGMRQQSPTCGRTTAGECHSESCCLVGHPLGTGLEGHPGDGDDRNGSGRIDTTAGGSVAAPGCTNGFWRDCDWLPFRDGKIRPVEPGTFPLVAGSPSVVGRLRAYGNAIVAPVAEEFIRAYMSCQSQNPN